MRKWPFQHLMFAVIGGLAAVVLLLAALSGASEAEGTATFSMGGSRAPVFILVVGVTSGAGFFVLNKRYLDLKYLIDKFIGALGLLISSPMLLIAAIVVRRDSGGPVLYRQKRVGVNRRNGERRRHQYLVEIDRRLNGLRRRRDYGGQVFTLYKLRTMRADAEEETGPVWASDDDPRVTPVGRFLRKTHVDELPQFVNVLKGEMSLIGPRPERPFFVELFNETIEGYKDRLRVRPGLTGLGQLWVGYDENVETVKRKLEADRLYIRQRSLLLDLKILMWTALDLLRLGFAFRKNGKRTPFRVDSGLVVEDRYIMDSRPSTEEPL